MSVTEGAHVNKESRLFDSPLPAVRTPPAIPCAAWHTQDLRRRGWPTSMAVTTTAWRAAIVRSASL